MVSATPRPLYPRELAGTRCIRGWVGLRTGLEGCEKPRPPPGFDPREHICSSLDIRRNHEIRCASTSTDRYVDAHYKEIRSLTHCYTDVL